MITCGARSWYRAAQTVLAKFDAGLESEVLDDQRYDFRVAAGMPTGLREAVGADELTTRLGPVLSATDAVFEWPAPSRRARVSGPQDRRQDRVPDDHHESSPYDQLRRVGSKTASVAGPCRPKSMTQFLAQWLLKAA
jgi:hypothetical protein